MAQPPTPNQAALTVPDQHWRRPHAEGKFWSISIPLWNHNVRGYMTARTPTLQAIHARLLNLHSTAGASMETGEAEDAEYTCDYCAENGYECKTIDGIGESCVACYVKRKQSGCNVDDAATATATAGIRQAKEEKEERRVEEEVRGGGEALEESGGVEGGEVEEGEGRGTIVDSIEMDGGEVASETADMETTDMTFDQLRRTIAKKSIGKLIAEEELEDAREALEQGEMEREEMAEEITALRNKNRALQVEKRDLEEKVFRNELLINALKKE